MDALDFVANRMFTKSNGARLNQDGLPVVKDMIILTDGQVKLIYLKLSKLYDVSAIL